MDIEQLRTVSAQIGSDPLLVQGAGGNISVKSGGKMLIKASGFWLSEAREKDIFVPVDLNGLKTAISAHDPRAGNAADFVIQSENPNGLRPSIETSVHAVFVHKYVVHVHCVRTLSYAVRTDAQAQLEKLLDGLDWIFVPYARPGLPLIKGIRERQLEQTNIVVLGNHGLIVAGNTLAQTNDLLREVAQRLDRPAATAMPAPDLMEICKGSAYVPAPDRQTHALAFDAEAIKNAAKGPLYPDHVIFLGAQTDISPDKKLPATARTPMIIIPEKGVVLAKDASAGAIALARCLSEVLMRVSPSAPLRFLSKSEIGELLNWDAEKYRQKLTKAPS